MPSETLQAAEMSGQKNICRSSEVSIESEDAVLFGLLDVGLLVLADALLEKVCLAGEGDHVHPLEGILHVVVLGNT